MGVQRHSSRAVLAGLAVVILGTSACAAGMKREEVGAELTRVRGEITDELRAEMQSGDEQVAANANLRIDSLAMRYAAFEAELQTLEEDFNVQLGRIQARLELNVPVHFAYDDATVRPEDQPILDRFTAIVKEQFPQAIITVEGFTDPAGSAEYNEWLGTRRAEAVRQYLVSAGLSANQVKAVSYGEARERQVLPGQWGTDGAANRRVAFVIEHTSAPVETIRVAGERQ